MRQRVERALEKAVRCYDDDAARLCDIVRQVQASSKVTGLVARPSAFFALEHCTLSCLTLPLPPSLPPSLPLSLSLSPSPFCVFLPLSRPLPLLVCSPTLSPSFRACMPAAARALPSIFVPVFPGIAPCSFRSRRVRATAGALDSATASIPRLCCLSGAQISHHSVNFEAAESRVTALMQSTVCEAPAGSLPSTCESLSDSDCIAPCRADPSVVGTAAGYRLRVPLGPPPGPAGRGAGPRRRDRAGEEPLQPPLRRGEHRRLQVCPRLSTRRRERLALYRWGWS